MEYHSLIITTLLLVSKTVLAAACCGGSSSLPSLITGDYRQQWSMTYSNAAIVFDADTESKIQPRNSSLQEVNETFLLRAAYVLDSRIQYGLELPIKLNTKKLTTQEESSSSISDISFQIAYEFLPELEFSKWKPRGFIFLKQVIPVGKSTYNSEKMLMTDATSNGFFTTSLGLGFYKVISQFDWQALADLSFKHSREFTTSSGDKLYISPGIEQKYLLSAGYSPNNGNWRFGTGIQYLHSAAAKSSLSQSKYILESNGNLSYVIDNKSFSISYFDQSFWGTAKNSPLAKGITFSFTQFTSL